MTRTSEAPQDVAALPQTEAGKRLLNWSAYDGVARLEEILEIEREAVAGLLDQNDRLRSALEGMVEQFAYWSDIAGGYWTGGLSALEEAFDVLGWPDPRAEPAARCDEPGCMNHATTGWPHPDGYRRTCYEHNQFINRAAVPVRGSGAEEAARNG